MLVGRGVAGYLARRLIPIVVILPVTGGWLQLVGQERGIYARAMGRRCWSSEVGTIGPGNHVLAVPARLAPGIYTLRLTQGESELRARCAVFR